MGVGRMCKIATRSCFRKKTLNSLSSQIWVRGPKYSQLIWRGPSIDTASGLQLLTQKLDDCQTACPDQSYQMGLALQSKCLLSHRRSLISICPRQRRLMDHELLNTANKRASFGPENPKFFLYIAYSTPYNIVIS